MNITVNAGDGDQCLLLWQRDTVNNPRAVTIKNEALNYALKIDHLPPGNHDAINIVMGPLVTAATAVGINAGNLSLSTVKVLNYAPQTGGDVIGAIGSHHDRTAPIFATQNHGRCVSYQATAFAADAMGFCSKGVINHGGDHFQAKDWLGHIIFRVDANGDVWSKGKKIS